MSVEDIRAQIDAIDDRLLKEDEKNKRVRYWLGLVHLRAKRYAEAEKEFKAS